MWKFFPFCYLVHYYSCRNKCYFYLMVLLDKGTLESSLSANIFGLWSRLKNHKKNLISASIKSQLNATISQINIFCHQTNLICTHRTSRLSSLFSNELPSVRNFTFPIGPGSRQTFNHWSTHCTGTRTSWPCLDT